MVMGKVMRHNVEISSAAGLFTGVCQCGWRNKENDANLVRAKSHLHIAEQATKE